MNLQSQEVAVNREVDEMSRPECRRSTGAMTFTELLDEYLEPRLHDLSDEEIRRLSEVVYELNVRCPPKK